MIVRVFKNVKNKKFNKKRVIFCAFTLSISKSFVQMP